MRNFRKFLTCAGLALALTLPATASLRAEMVMKRGNGAEPELLDPAISTGVPESFIQIDIFEGLVHPGPDGTPAARRGGKLAGQRRRPDLYLPSPSGCHVVGRSPLTAEGLRLFMGTDGRSGDRVQLRLHPVADQERRADHQGRVAKGLSLAAEAVDDHTLKMTLRAPTRLFPPAADAPLGLSGAQGRRSRSSGRNGRGRAISSATAPTRSRNGCRRAHIKAGQESEFPRRRQRHRSTRSIYYPTEEYGTELKQFRAGELRPTYDVPQSRSPGSSRTWQTSSAIRPISAPITTAST